MLAFFEWKSMWWLDEANQRQNLELSVKSGIKAYTWGSKYGRATSVVTQGGSLSEEDEYMEQDDRSDAGELNIDDILDFE